MKKIKNLLLLAALIGTTSVPAFANGLVVCDKGICAQQILSSNAGSYLNAIKNLLQSNPNARIDICDADPRTHQCVNNAMHWQASTNTSVFNMALANARVNVVDKDITLDYLLVANNAYPRCNFSPIELSALADRRIRIVSSAYNCNLMETEPTNLQKIFVIDFIDVDSRVLGGTYQVQTGGALRGQHIGYALMQFRGASSPLPLVAPMYGNVAQPIPAAATEKTSDQLFAEQKEWWNSVKVDWGRVCNAMQGQTCPASSIAQNNEIQSTTQPKERDLSLAPDPVFVAPPVKGLSDTEKSQDPVFIAPPVKGLPETKLNTPVNEEQPVIKDVKPKESEPVQAVPAREPVSSTQNINTTKDLSLEPTPVFVAPRVEEPEVVPTETTRALPKETPAERNAEGIYQNKENNVKPAPHPNTMYDLAKHPTTCSVYPCTPEEDTNKPWYNSVKQAFMNVLYLEPIE